MIDLVKQRRLNNFTAALNTHIHIHTQHSYSYLLSGRLANNGVDQARIDTNCHSTYIATSSFIDVPLHIHEDSRKTERKKALKLKDIVS